MSLRSTWHQLTALADFHPRFFTRYEWWSYVLMMPVLFSAGNYYLIGLAYFSDPMTFGVGTALVFVFYWLSIITLTITIRRVIRRYPGMRYTILRTLVMLLTVGMMTGGLALLGVWIYSLVPLTRVSFDWATIWPIWEFGLVLDAFLCLSLSLVYTYTQWKQELREDEHLQRQALQRQYDTLKGQLNPHFLFNALSSLSVLISEEPERAEQFVDKMARVYRYMLQPVRPADRAVRAGGGIDPAVIDQPVELVPLQAELEFISLYADLLQVRYNSSLRIDRPTIVSPAYLTQSLLPLSLLTLVDNAVKHNAMSVGKPLVIRIEITPDGWLQVTNNRQQKTIRLETTRASLTSLMARYRLLSKEPLVETTDGYFKVSLPLLDV